MAIKHNKSRGTKSKNIETIKMPSLESILKKEIANYSFPANKKKFTKEEDDLILKYWKQAGAQKKIANIINCCVDTCRTRYRELIKIEHKV